MKFLAILFSLALSGCNKFSSKSPDIDYVPLSVAQDKNNTLTIDVSGTNTENATYTYTLSSLPAWASFDETTSILTGMPKVYADGFNTFLSRYKDGVLEKQFPYRINVLGNPLKEAQWHLSNTGQTAFAGKSGTAGEDIHMGTVIADGIDGTGVKIAISDTGVMLSHEAISPNVIAGASRNYFNDYSTTMSWLGDSTPDTKDAEDAHGTAVASLAAAAGWTGKGIRGVAPSASLAGFLFIQAQMQLWQNGYWSPALFDQFTGDFDIFNYSWGDDQCEMTQYSPTLMAFMSNGVTSQRSGLGSIYVMSSGNNQVDSMSSCVANATGKYYGSAEFSDINTTPYTFIVGAMNAHGKISSYSSPGANLVVSAPGGEYGLSETITGYPHANEPAMVAADFPGCNVGIKSMSGIFNKFDTGAQGNTGCKYTATMNGTSSAAPVVSGAIALILQANPALTWRDVKYILASTSDIVDPTVNPNKHPNTSYNLAGHTYEQGWITNAAGFHFMNYYGFGRINVANAVSLAKLYAVNLGTFDQSYWADSSGTINTAIPNNSAAGLSRTITTASTLVLEAVQLKVSLSNCIGDMGIELTSPAGTKSIIVNINSRLQDGTLVDQTFLSNAFYGETATGTWTLKVIDGQSSCTGNLVTWSLNFAGH